ncbi:MAG: pro-sigmaK processing inhibitor BofA family protein [Oscillospiraceae bacterium]|jgi:inhibitor of the pro-sigma K processing machinery|nr:pro-sigmaK processing inhibitor BofA family protein [Oscillospiraceae bacterium]
MFDVAFIFLAAVLFLPLCKTLVTFRRPLLAAVAHFAAGIAALVAAVLIMSAFGYYITVNVFTAGVALLLGVPGVALLVLFTLFV